MIIKKITVNNFRNIKEAELEFTEGCNVFYGENAQGKTNMLEALSICLGNSFRQTRPASFVPFLKDNEKPTYIKLNFTLDNIESRENTVEFTLSSNNKPSVIFNGIELNSAIDLYGELKYVVFTPDDLNLIKGIPDFRRVYLDNIAILQNKTHNKYINEYKRALNQKNALNLELIKDNSLLGTSETWNDILARQGINLTYGRIKFFDMLKNYSLDLYSEISGDKEKLEMYYKSTVFGNIFTSSDIDFEKKEILYNKYISLLNLPSAIGLDGKTRIGAHRDDIIFDINNYGAREFGSQGQLRSIALVLKLAEAETIRDYNNERPVILLDEILSEFDSNRRGFVIKHFDKSQVFITSCNINDFRETENLRIWEVKEGNFKRLKGEI